MLFFSGPETGAPLSFPNPARADWTLSGSVEPNTSAVNLGATPYAGTLVRVLLSFNDDESAQTFQLDLNGIATGPIVNGASDSGVVEIPLNIPVAANDTVGINGLTVNARLGVVFVFA